MGNRAITAALFISIFQLILKKKTSQFGHSLIIIDSTIVVDRGIQIAHNLTVALVCCCVLLVLLCVHWQVGSSEPGRIMRRQRKARSFAFAFVALLLLPLNQTGKRAEAKETRSQDPCSF